MRAQVVLGLGSLAVALAACIGDTGYASDVTETAATLRAWGQSSSGSADFYFEYGPSPSMALRTPLRRASRLPINTSLPIQESVTNLTPNSTYYYRVCGKESSAQSFVCATPRRFITTRFTHPLVDESALDGVMRMGDPKILRDGATYYLSGSGCRVLESTNLLRFRRPIDVCGSAAGKHPASMVLTPRPEDQNVNFWGTEVSKIGNTYVLVTSGMRSWGSYSRGAIWIGTASNIAGPYTWSSDAVVKDPNSTMIDPSLFVGPDGRIWLTWVQHQDRPAWSLHNTLYAIELAANPAQQFPVRAGATPTAVLSTDVEPQDRELAFPRSGQRIVEGQGVFYRDGRYYLYYAAGTCEYHEREGRPYTFNVASSTTFPTRFQKPSAPLLAGGRGWRMPGHGAVFQDGNGGYWLAAHAFQNGDTTCESTDPGVRAFCAFRRTLFLQSMSYDSFNQRFSIGDGILQPGLQAVPVP
jgi:beta-xylosidase